MGFSSEFVFVILESMLDQGREMQKEEKLLWEKSGSRKDLEVLDFRLISSFPI